MMKGNMRKKVTVVGAGNVGAGVAHGILSKELADVVIIDVVEGLSQGKSIDLSAMMPIGKSDCHIQPSDSYAEAANSDIIVIAAGIPRKPGMSRDDLLQVNYEIVSTVVDGVVAVSPNSILIVATNPLDVMVQVAYRRAGFSRNRIIGMAGALDSARFRLFIARELGVSVESVTALVLGAHGDKMLPLARYSTVAGIPITVLIDRARLDSLIDRTRNGGAEVVGHLKTGGAYYAPSAAVVEMVEAILKDKKKILPCAAYLEGEYGITGLCLGVPCKLGGDGVEQILEVKLTPDETRALHESAEAIRRNCTVIGI
jgi:malate dehydrogenase